jgi:hypothetical protein
VKVILLLYMYICIKVANIIVIVLKDIFANKKMFFKFANQPVKME